MSEKDLGQLARADVERQFQTILGDIQAWMDLYDEEIKALEKKIKDLDLQSTQELASLKALRRLLHDFKQFAEDYHQFFQGVRVYGSGSKVNFLNVALGRILKEWATIQRAVEQRKTKYRDHLRETDRVAADYYRAFRGAKASSAIVTYFEKVNDIARSLYSPIPIIGIPLSAYDAPEGWLSIAHEVGHYIYWNYAALDKYREVQKNLEKAVTEKLVVKHADELGQDPDTFVQYAETIRVCLKWLDEIFADIYGTLVAGPAFASSIQRVLLGEANLDNLCVDDGEHPIACLRPFTHTQVLREMAGEEEKKGNTQFATDLRNQATELEKQWEAHWQKAGFKEEQACLQSGQVSIKISRLKEELSDMVSSLLRAKVIPDREGQKRCLLDLELVDYYRELAHNKVREAQRVLLDKEASLDRIEASPWTFVSASQRALSGVTSGTATSGKIRRSTRGKIESQLTQPSVIEEPEPAVAFSEVLAYLTETDEPSEQKEKWERLLALDLSTASAEIFITCRHCGALNPATNTKCWRCGRRL
jgi:hypothetical protein